MSWIQTKSGRHFSFLDPRPDSIHIGDIASALSMQCRFNGHTSMFYSVAEHCVLMSLMVPREHEFQALMHDAAEAYVGDIAAPLKALLPDYKAIEACVEAAVFERFSVRMSADCRESIKHADLRMLAMERNWLMGHCERDWEVLAGVTPFDIHPPCWGPAEARSEFMDRFQAVIKRQAA